MRAGAGFVPRARRGYHYPMAPGTSAPSRPRRPGDGGDPPALEILDTPPGPVLRLGGHWTTERLAAVEAAVGEVVAGGRYHTVDATAITALDTAGALLLTRVRNAARERTITGLEPGAEALVERVARQAEAEVTPGEPPWGWLARLGLGTVEQGREAVELLDLLGRMTTAGLRALVRPDRLRWRSVSAHLQRTGLDAMPIIGLLAFLIGVVIAYQGGVQLRNYGAGIFIVELVTVTTVRELGPLLAAIIVAGRSGSAFAAEIGSMRVSEEIDAIRALGLDPIEVLVLPRTLALMVSLPLLTGFCDVAAVLGGMAMAAPLVDLPPADFIERVPQAVSVTSVLVGLVKAPVFAVVIALTGCGQGLAAGASAAEVGRRTTRSVVQGIFLVIVVDAAFSVAFSMMGI